MSQPTTAIDLARFSFAYREGLCDGVAQSLRMLEKCSTLEEAKDLLCMDLYRRVERQERDRAKSDG